MVKGYPHPHTWYKYKKACDPELKDDLDMIYPSLNTKKVKKAILGKSIKIRNIKSRNKGDILKEELQIVIKVLDNSLPKELIQTILNIIDDSNAKISNDDLKFIKELTNGKKPDIWSKNIYDLLKRKANK